MRPKTGQAVIYKGEKYTVQAVYYWTASIRPASCAYGFHDFNVRHDQLQPAKR